MEEAVAGARIAEFSVSRLFGLFDHRVVLNQQSGITIIHGPNGVGKTRLLRMVAAVAERNFAELRRVKFDTMRVVLESGAEIRIFREMPGGQLPLADASVPEEGEPRLFIQIHVQGKAPLECRYPNLEHPRQPQPGRRAELRRFIESSLPYHAVPNGRYVDERTGAMVPLSHVVSEYADVFPPRLLRHLGGPVIPEIDRFLSSLNVEYISTERLTTRREAPSDSRSDIEATASAYSRDLVRRLSVSVAEYGRVSARLERTFPQRAINAPQSDIPDAAEVRDKYESVTSYRERLTDAGLLEPSADLPWPERALNDTERQFLDLYLEDTSSKLAVFGSLLTRIEVLTEMLNDRFSYKQVMVDREVGLKFGLPSGEVLGTADLSSGEQHEVVFAYRMLFRTAPGALVLIDEPEISLHVSWQQRFLRDLAKFNSVNELHFLIATHSPHIIHNRREWSQRLAGNVS